MLRYKAISQAARNIYRPSPIYKQARYNTNYFEEKFANTKRVNDILRDTSQHKDGANAKMKEMLQRINEGDEDKIHLFELQSGYSKVFFFIRQQLTITLGGMLLFMIDKYYNRQQEINSLHEKNKPNKAKKLQRNNNYIIAVICFQSVLIFYSNLYCRNFLRKFVRNLHYLPKQNTFEINFLKKSVIARPAEIKLVKYSAKQDDDKILTKYEFDFDNLKDHKEFQHVAGEWTNKDLFEYIISENSQTDKNDGNTEEAN